MATGKRYLKEFQRLLGIFEAFREIDADGQMPIQAAQTFVLVAMNPGCSQAFLCERTGLSQSSVSRNLQSLSEWARAGKKGANLIEAVPDPLDTRKKRIFLTIPGRRLAEKALGHVVGDKVDDLDAPAAKEFVSGVRRAAMG